MQNAELRRYSKANKVIPVVLLLVFLVIALPMGGAAANAGYGYFAEPNRAIAPSIPAEVIFARSTDAVFMIETFDSHGETIRTGSGFFISETGLALTVLHVLDNAASATITLYNGDVYPVRGANSVSEEFNLAVISIESDKTDWPYLALADSDSIEVGNSVYVIGSPLGYFNTMTAGIISTVTREVEGAELIQFTAPISFGSGGSPMLNSRGQVIGLASSSFSYGQHMNLAVPVNHIKSMPTGECVPLATLLSD